MDLTELRRLHATEMRANTMANSGKRPEVAFIDKVKKVAVAGKDKVVSGYTVVKDAVKGTVRTVGAAKDMVKSGVKEVIQDAGRLKDMLKNLFSGDVDDYPTGYNLLTEMAPVFTGELSDADMNMVKEGLNKLFPNTYSGTNVNDGAAIERTIIRPTAMILAKNHGLDPLILFSMLKAIAFYETSLRNSVMSRLDPEKPAGLFQYIPSVRKRMAETLGPLKPGDTQSEITYAVNYFGQLINTAVKKMTWPGGSNPTPIPGLLKTQALNDQLYAAISAFPFLGIKKFDIPLLVMIFHRSGFNPTGVGYSNENLAEIMTKRLPSLIKTFAVVKPSIDYNKMLKA